jgi:Werner syndrome ATP-dependent helicase
MEEAVNQSTNSHHKEKAVDESSISKAEEDDYYYRFEKEVSNEQEVSSPLTESTSPTEEHLSVLSATFGHREFKPLQWEIIRSVMSDRADQCVVMATGYGKSLLYQFPAVYSGKTSLVVSPLIALMEDQVLSLQVLDVQARFLGSALKDKNSTYQDIRADKVRVVYVTPEFVDSATETLLSLIPEERLALIAIDEAHCVSQWGHDFRDSYRKLRKLREAYRSVPIMALTATATDDVVKDIALSLDLRTPRVSTTSFDRPNLVTINLNVLTNMTSTSSSNGNYQPKVLKQQ